VRRKPFGLNVEEYYNEGLVDMKKTRLIWLVGNLLSVSITFAQPGIYPMEKTLKAELDSLAAGGNVINRYQFDSSNEKYFLNFLKGYENRREPMLQMRVLSLKFIIGIGSNDSALRQTVVIDLIKALDESPRISQFAASMLITLKERDFSEEARNLIEAAYPRLQYENNFILLCGIAQVKSLIPSLEKAALNFDRHQIQNYYKQGWYARLALARMNATKSIDTLIAGVELYPEKVFRITRLLKQITYTRHVDALRLLLNYLKSSDVMTGAGMEIAVNAYAMEFLATYMDNFPVKAKYLSYSKDEIKLGIAYLEKIVMN
jgi:hypothetical protein